MENYIQNLLDGYTELPEEKKKDLEEIKVEKVDWETLKKERELHTADPKFYGKYPKIFKEVDKMVDIVLKYESLGDVTFLELFSKMSPEDVNEYNGLIEKSLNIQMKISKDHADNPIE